MRVLTRQVLAGCAALSAVAAAVYAPETSNAGQAVADALSSTTSASIAFVPDGVLNRAGKDDDLASWLQFPTDTVSVVKLTGKQVRAALERSVSLYPSPNPSFLQVSGLDVQFDKSKAPDVRVMSVLVNGTALDDKATYEVAMPTSLAKGGLGYFMIWEKTAVTKTLAKTTLGSACKGKRVFASDPRWKQVGKS